MCGNREYSMRSEREQAYAFIPALFPLWYEFLTSRQILCLNMESDFLTLILCGFLQQTGQMDFFLGGERGEGSRGWCKFYCVFVFEAQFVYSFHKYQQWNSLCEGRAWMAVSECHPVYLLITVQLWKAEAELLGYSLQWRRKKLSPMAFPWCGC